MIWNIMKMFICYVKSSRYSVSHIIAHTFRSDIITENSRKDGVDDSGSVCHKTLFSRVLKLGGGRFW